jgi:lipopolysaccharide biosynthesis glycosyltransferase
MEFKENPIYINVAIICDYEFIRGAHVCAYTILKNTNFKVKFHIFYKNINKIYMDDLKNTIYLFDNA